jgi:hypothetical protein
MDNVTLLLGTFAFPHDLFNKLFSASVKPGTTTDVLEVRRNMTGSRLTSLSLFVDDVSKNPLYTPDYVASNHMEINSSNTARIMKRNVFELTENIPSYFLVVKENNHKNLRIISVQVSNLTPYE